MPFRHENHRQFKLLHHHYLCWSDRIRLSRLCAVHSDILPKEELFVCVGADEVDLHYREEKSKVFLCRSEVHLMRPAAPVLLGKEEPGLCHLGWQESRAGAKPATLWEAEKVEGLLRLDDAIDDNVCHMHVLGAVLARNRLAHCSQARFCRQQENRRVSEREAVRCHKQGIVMGWSLDLLLAAKPAKPSLPRVEEVAPVTRRLPP